MNKFVATILPCVTAQWGYYDEPIATNQLEDLYAAQNQWYAWEEDMVWACTKPPCATEKKKEKTFRYVPQQFNIKKKLQYKIKKIRGTCRRRIKQCGVHKKEIHELTSWEKFDKNMGESFDVLALNWNMTKV